MTSLRISTDPAELDVPVIHRFLSEQSYWAKGISRTVVEKAIAGSLCFGAYTEAGQVAFARVVTDSATFAYLKDVFVLPEHRGHGYGVAIMQAVMGHPALQTVQILLGTADAHGLYTRFGFVTQLYPERRMVRPGSFLPKAQRE